MKAIMVMFDSLNRHMLPPYGAHGIHAPNFERLGNMCRTDRQKYARYLSLEDRLNQFNI